MKLSRDISGDELVRLLAKFGYHTLRQTGSHIRLVSSFKGTQHPLTIPRHKSLKVVR
jgi:predicted RNA binding protein YcfA (HicA-like mRNA interferase family)